MATKLAAIYHINMKPIKKSCIVQTLMLQLLALISFNCFSQTESTKIEIGKKVKFHSQVLGEEREIWIRLPEGYQINDTSKYPVVYLLDGPSNFVFTAGLLRQLEIRSVPKSILVGIVNTNRIKDLTPSKEIKDGVKPDSTSGGANDFIKMFEEDLFPYIKQNYRVNEFKTLIGHSFGGLFAIHTLATKPKLFNAYLAISPSLWWDSQKTVDYFESSLKANPEMKGLLYLTMANERGSMLGGMLKLVGILESESPKNLRWDYKVYPNEHHGSVPVISQIEGFHFFYRDWHISSPYSEYEKYGMDAFEVRSKRIKNEFGEDWNLDNESYSDFLYELNENKRYSDQLELSLKLIDKGHKVLEFYEAAARSYYALNDKKSAATYYKEAFKLNPGYIHVNKMLDSLGIAKNQLIKPEVLTKVDLRRYSGNYSDGFSNYSIKVLGDSLQLIAEDEYFQLTENLASIGKHAFYISNGFYTLHFIIDEKNNSKTSHLIIRGTNGWVRKLPLLSPSE